MGKIDEAVDSIMLQLQQESAKSTRSSGDQPKDKICDDVSPDDNPSSKSETEESIQGEKELFDAKIQQLRQSIEVIDQTRKSDEIDYGDLMKMIQERELEKKEEKGQYQYVKSSSSEINSKKSLENSLSEKQFEFGENYKPDSISKSPTHSDQYSG